MKEENQKLIKSFVYPLIGVVILWVIFLVQWAGSMDPGYLGVRPRELMGLIGLITGPLVHGSLDHIMSNSLPVLFLSTGVLYFYRSISTKVLIYAYFMPSVCVWIVARSSSHIGISGMIYALAFFLFFSGVFRKDVRALALALIVSFLYGSMIWGIFPLQPEANISWEGHLFGAITGTVIAWFFRNEGPKRKSYSWENEADDGIEHLAEPWNYKKLVPPPEGFTYPE